MNNIQFLDKLKELTAQSTIQWRFLHSDVFRYCIKGQVVEISRNMYTILPGASTYKFEVFDHEKKIFSHTVDYLHRNRPLESHIIDLFNTVYKNMRSNYLYHTPV